MATPDTPCAGELTLREFNKTSGRTWQALDNIRDLPKQFWDNRVFLPSEASDEEYYEDDENWEEWSVDEQKALDNVASILATDKIEAVEDSNTAMPGIGKEAYSNEYLFKIFEENQYNFAFSCILGGWRPRQSIVRFAPKAAHQIIKEFSPDEPAKSIWGLPDWTIYFDVQLSDSSNSCDGFFAANDITEFDEGGEEYLLLCFVKGKDTVVLRATTDGTAEDSKNDAVATYTHSSIAKDHPLGKEISDKMIIDAMALVAYVVKYGYDAGTDWPKTAEYPKPKKVRKGLRLFPAAKPTIHVLGKYAESSTEHIL